MARARESYGNLVNSTVYYPGGIAMSRRRKAQASRVRTVVVTQGSLGCASGHEPIAFQVRWKENVEATLVRLRDNMFIKAEMVDGTRSIALQYCAVEASLHRIRWYLQSRENLTGLVASARREGGEIQRLGKTDGPTHVWEHDGVLE
jgi:hypothetical protein